ncbi:hypothetical protein Dpo_29c00030 [Desulfotignum phosphitoxidans DSM 13687]|uniref:Uncharacterized protein n=1 Tax=Desulfotignum phosphitoxidans DSM 13687 TaxID=1286635 RepID=S0FVI0_9BACT|nr:hypothetical protein Dpo_29c00030 [Desulfotignum phosphitoxidans DSM 13687]
MPWVAEQILESLEKEHPSVDIDSWEMLKQIYHKEYERLRRGVLSPIWKKDKAKFEEKFSERIMTLYENTSDHSIRTLQAASKKYGRRPFLVFDNADQHDSTIQNDVFLVAQKMAQSLNCSCLISLREESYWKNRDFGALSAFHSISYHVQAPRLEQIIAKRFKYAKKLICDQRLLGQGGNSHKLTPKEIDEVVSLLAKTVLGEDKRFIEFAEYLCPGEVRRPLDFFARFMYSGHTNVNSLLRAVRKNMDLFIGFHEFVTAIMLCDREYFSESASDILNIFSIDGRGDANHFNRITVIGRVLRDRDKMSESEIGHGFVPIHSVIKDCEILGLLPETTTSIITLLIKRRLLQTETQIREDISNSNYIRATSASLYYLEKLVYESAYIESILFDTPIENKEYFETIKKLSKHANDSEDSGERLNRLRFRLERNSVFIDYLIDRYNAIVTKFSWIQ